MWYISRSFLVQYYQFPCPLVEGGWSTGGLGCNISAGGGGSKDVCDPCCGDGLVKSSALSSF